MICQESGKQDSFRHILKSVASIYESLGSQFFRTTTWIQSAPDALHKSSLVMTFLTNLGAIEILCSFRLVLDGRTSKDIPESSRFRVSRKVLRKRFCFIRYRRQYFQVIE